MKSPRTLAILLSFASIAFALGDPAPPEIKAPPGTDAKLTSADPDYGYKKEKAILVGEKDAMGGPAAERAYFDTLRDEAGKHVTYDRQGSVGGGPDGHILDAYSVKTSTGRAVVLYIDMYHFKNAPKKQPAPAGLFKAR